MVSIDFDFGRYIASRRGEVQQRARDGSAYSFAGERKVRRALQSARPVILALEATSKTWRKRGRTELLEGAELATDERFPEVYKACAEAARVLAIEPPSVYIAREGFPVSARALGTDDDAYIIVAARLVEILNPKELVAVIGHELGHVQNNHILYTTALFYLQHSAAMFLRWSVQPAVMALQAWSRRAEVTCDRAALICTRELDVTLRALVKATLASQDKLDDEHIEAYLAQDAEAEDRGITKIADLFRSHPYLPKRIQALRLFADGRFYRKFAGQEPPSGLSADEVDEQVSELVSVI